MGRLIDYDDFFKGKLKIEHYFTDWVRSSPNSSRFHEDGLRALASDFPHTISVHFDNIENSYYSESGLATRRKTFIEVRRFIERQLHGEVIFREVDMSHHYHIFCLDLTWCQFKTHGYVIFHFELESEASIFALAFSHLISEIEPTHPDVSQDQLLSLQETFASN